MQAKGDGVCGLYVIEGQEVIADEEDCDLGQTIGSREGAGSDGVR